MKLTNLKTELGETDCMPQAAYPYGLRLYLNCEQCEALGITKALAAGTSVTLQAKAIVVRSTQELETEADEAGPDISLELQITDLGLESGKVLTNAAALLYPKQG